MSIVAACAHSYTYIYIHIYIYIHTRARVQFSELFLPLEVFVLLANLFLKVRTYIKTREIFSSARYCLAQAFSNASAGIVSPFISFQLRGKVSHVHTCIRNRGFVGVALRVDHRYFDPPYIYILPRNCQIYGDTLFTRGTMCLRIVTSYTNCSF